MFAAWSGCAAPSSQPPTPARCCSTGTYSNARPRAAFPAGEPCHRSWNRTLVPSSGEDLRPWWPTARYLPRSTRTSSPPRNSQWPRRPLGSPGSGGGVVSSTPPKPEYEPFADQVREAVAETLADNARYQEQARRLLEGQGEGDVTPASPAISQRGPAVLSYSSAVRAAMGPGVMPPWGPRSSRGAFPGHERHRPQGAWPGAVLSGYCCFLCSASTSRPPRSYRCLSGQLLRPSPPGDGEHKTEYPVLLP